MLRVLAISWAFNLAALWVAAKIIDGISYGNKFWTLLIAALVFAIVNMIIRPLVTFFTLPLVIITLGIALFAINILMLYLTHWIVHGFEIKTFGAAVLATIIIWLVNVALRAIFRTDEKSRQAAR